MENLALLTPELVLAGLALALMLADMVLPRAKSRWLYHLAWLSSAGVLALVVASLGGPTARGTGTLWIADSFGQFFKLTTLLTATLCLLMGLDYRALPEKHAGTFAALMLFSTAGLMFLVAATDLLLVFVSLELVSISSFILTGFERGNPKSNEGSMKYFLFGAFSSAILVYGIALYYGATGGTKLVPGAGAPTPMLILSLVLILLGFAFKASIAPMHFWVPDAYEGAPTPVTTFLSVAPKLATFAALMRLFGTVFPAAQYDLQALLGLLAVLTMTVGNFTAFFQDDAKRLLAYSSVAQAGYLLIGLAVGTARGTEGVLMYAFVYVAMNIGAFAVVQAVGQSEESYSLDSFDGLARRSLGLSLAMTFCLLSLAGIPPLAGFMGKLYIFSSAVEAGRWWLAVAGVVNSVASAYFYFRLAHRMFFRAPKEGAQALPIGPYVYGGIAVAIVGVLLFGVFPEPLIAGVRASAPLLP
ncbi:MAG: NADH-quinone oxidoreductase subunit N [Elusimicrobia bacterium]|nr:NADH-quinone oxidoreductase subunit N [Elusimicrobiota bacterium]